MSCQPEASRVCMVSVCHCEDQRLNVVLAGVPVSRVLKHGGKGGSATVCDYTSHRDVTRCGEFVQVSR